MNSLLPTLTVLKVASVLDVIVVHVENYASKYSSLPKIVKVNYALRPALTKELIKRMHMAPDCAIAEPFWLGEVPIIYARDIGDYYLELSNKKAGFIETF